MMPWIIFFHAIITAKVTKDLDHCLNQSGQDAKNESKTPELSRPVAQQESSSLPPDGQTGVQGPVEQRTESRVRRLRLLADCLPTPTSHLFYLLATDATSLPRPYAEKLEDRHIAYMPNPAPGNKPITVGHKYSVIAILPEKNGPSAPPWAIPLSIEQIPSHQTDKSVAAKQIRTLLTDADLPFLNHLAVNVADSLYCTAHFLGSVNDINNLINIVRCSSNRVFYFQPDPTESRKKKGHPTWYGQRFDMKDPDSWGNPDQTISYQVAMASGKIAILEQEVWNDLLMKGKQKIPMHKDPFTLIRCRLLNEDGSLVFNRPLWLIVFGKRRMELSPEKAWLCYRQRYDIEHFFRFGKNHLLMGRYQTSVVEHEENWLEIIGLAYFQLWIASSLATALPYPWERYSMPTDSSKSPGPSMTQRNFERIIQQVGKQPPPPKPRGKSPGRLLGQCPGLRQKQEVVFKGKKRTKKKAA